LLPIPANYTIFFGNYDIRADALAAGMRLRDIESLVHLEVVSGLAARALGRDTNFLVIAGIAGSDPEVAYLQERVSRALDNPEWVKDAEAITAYERLRDLVDQDTVSGALAAEIAVPLTELPQVLEVCGCEFRAHAGSGVAQLFDGPQSSDNGNLSPDKLAASVERWRKSVHDARGILRILRLPPDARAQIAIFDDPPAPALMLMRRLKATFDPRGIFNPGCFVGGL
jgi:FAD/FMN-containing dehydrogenase